MGDSKVYCSTFLTPSVLGRNTEAALGVKIMNEQVRPRTGKSLAKLIPETGSGCRGCLLRLTFPCLTWRVGAQAGRHPPPPVNLSPPLVIQRDRRRQPVQDTWLRLETRRPHFLVWWFWSSRGEEPRQVLAPQPASITPSHAPLCVLLSGFSILFSPLGRVRPLLAYLLT